MSGSSTAVPDYSAAVEVESAERNKPQGSSEALIAGSTLLAGICIAHIVVLQPYSWPSLVTSVFVWTAVALLVWHSLGCHQHAVFGQANAVTLLRAVSAALLAGFIPIAADITSIGMLWAIAIIATITLCMDGLDGYLARKQGLSSAFGARFDMEVDALLALIITLFLWQSEKLGPWVLGLGLMRYAFLAAAIWLTPLQGELHPSLRRKSICVVQVGALCLMLCPLLSTPQVTVVGLIALLGLSYSFAVDIVWLFRRYGKSVELP